MSGMSFPFRANPCAAAQQEPAVHQLVLARSQTIGKWQFATVRQRHRFLRKL